MLNSNGNVYNVCANYKPVLLFSLYYYVVFVKRVKKLQVLQIIDSQTIKKYHNSMMCEYCDFILNK